MGSTQNEQIAGAAIDLLVLLDRVVPGTTLDYRVEDARVALQALESAASRGDIFTQDRKTRERTPDAEQG
ncbi:hypothetical protein SEA_LOZINAK_159 [Gordonia phage Lozinak]|uniref:Uncharacterized protein n=4 Tax=Smoothievirus TaxID=1982557 RepID=A0A2D1GG13_9CAUD|nr:hypothetical protein BEN60_gp047 [Gordonia phage Smoothie]YP_009273195.1 hypothetical protein BH768_gp047 [Gordonia phage ClubL]YP_009276273.1 hypothetical protein BH772_gp049 [Gordonia phage Bachita]YP_009281312.1 hypothetical protein BIZ74_gp047 [Gordonia phage Cucurbita]ATN90785.1 hypothetical protein SEA_LOZINAK_159 [Gordonia phage Lozinak]AUE23665.1 hypothetical protein SEA_TONIANN_159 [Gordonia phage Toniann]QYC53641.1 hypothetical protein SEA_NORVS_157 [Gordonia phage Norvs]WKW8595